MYYTVYKVVNKVNGREYIGKHKTTNLADGYLGSGKLLRSAIKKYGKDCFSKEILFIFSSELEMNKKEEELVTEAYCQLDSNYNLKPGGRGGFAFVDQLKGSSLGVDARRALLKTNAVFRESHRQNSRKAYQAGLGKLRSQGWQPPRPVNFTHCDESKRKISLANRGRGNVRILCDGREFASIQQASECLGMSKQGIGYRLKTGKYQRI